VAARAEVRGLLESALAAHGADHWYAALTARGVPCGPINDLHDAVELASTLGLEPVVAVPGSVVPQVANPLRMSATPPTYRTAPPRLGEEDA
jgi:crotonobetainyl-CoA:carnitine CoA-transferase CaiB-like acyl-CoA transferase